MYVVIGIAVNYRIESHLVNTEYIGKREMIRWGT